MPRGRLFATLIISALVFAILIALGTWQMQRLYWKEGLIAEVAERADQPPIPVPPRAEWAKLDIRALEYRPVTAQGRFRPELESRIYALLGEAKGPASGPGYWIMTPLELEGGGVLIVNRGFVPLNGTVMADYSPPPAGVVTVAGLLRGAEERNPFTPEDKPDERLFYARDAGAIGNALGLTDVAPFSVDAAADPAGGLPQGGETRLTFTNRHLEYALTWYGLAGSLVAVLVAVLWRQRRRS